MRSYLTAWLLAACGILAACGFGATAAAEDGVPQDKTKFHLYLLIGQSNMAGRGKMDNPPKAPDRVLKLDKSMQWVPAVDPLHFDKPNIAGVGPGSGFGPAMAEANKEVVIGLIPSAVGGTPIRRWVPGADLYKDAVKRTHAALKHGELKGVIWHQGESDSGSLESAQAYEKQLQELVAGLRKEFKNPELPIVVGGLGDFLNRDKPKFSKEVTAVLKKVAEADDHMSFVPATGLTANSDQVHFNAESAREFGRRYAEAMRKLQSP